MGKIAIAVAALSAALLSGAAQAEWRKYDTTHELASQRRWREAITVLIPLANDPHDSPQRAAAASASPSCRRMRRRAAPHAG